MTRLRLAALVLITAFASMVPLSGRSGGQGEGATPPLARELASLLQGKKLDVVAARLDGDTFVAAMLIPGSELLVVSAKYSAPTLINEKILNRKYRDAYMDLSTGSVADSKLLVEDLKADGLRAEKQKDGFDIVTRGTAQPTHFNGEWKKQNMSQEAYMKAFQDAETAYQAMLRALVAELKKAG
jgi:hypothetical protein